jgi:hypothetical protein
MFEVARKAAASKIVRAIRIEVLHEQAYMIATLIQGGFANGVVCRQASLDGRRRQQRNRAA